jgi:hypothetical protein
VLRLCSAVPRGFGNEQVSSARWVWNPKFCPYVISCRTGVDSVACRGIFFLGYGYGFLAFLGHRALAAFCARLDRSAAVMPLAALAPPCCPRHTGQYSTTTSRVSG